MMHAHVKIQAKSAKLVAKTLNVMDQTTHRDNFGELITTL
jgi:hypothetical protein